jgi:phenylpropionate dioxygenase-like ring-hydroxylating dioxygenase large terminal subunit
MDPSVYFSEERFLAEKNGLFRQSPLMLALSCELPDPGDFKLHEDSGVPLILTRDKAGKAHVFLNACRHRAVKVTDKPCGNAARFTCPYHAWTYGSDGALVSLPAEDLFGDVDKGKLGLVEFPSEEKYGMIFGILQPSSVGGAQLDIEAFLGEGAAHIAGWHLERNKFVGERPLETKANWKLALDTFTENYHFHVLHSADFSY